MHERDLTTEILSDAIVRYAVDRTRLDPPPLDQPRTPAALQAAVGATITARGLGGTEALRVFAEQLAPATISTDHPRFLAFVPAAPTEAAILFDLVVGASSVYAGSWLEGAGAVYAENQALAWIADAGRDAGERRRCVRRRGHRREPLGARRRPPALACRRPTTRSAAGGDRLLRRRSFLDRRGGRG